MLRDSKAETTEGRLENVQELIQLAGSFHTARELLDHAALSTSGPKEGNADQVRLMTLHKGRGSSSRTSSCPRGRRARSRLTTATCPRNAGSRTWPSRGACGG